MAAVVATVVATVGQAVSVIISNIAKKTFQNGTDGLRIVKCYVNVFALYEIGCYVGFEYSRS